MEDASFVNQVVDRSRVRQLVERVLSSLEGEVEVNVKLAIKMVATLYEVDATSNDYRHDSSSVNESIFVSRSGEPVKEDDISTSVADLVAQTGAKNPSEIALVIAYWIQVCGGDSTFTGYEINKELANLGNRSTNITALLGGLMKKDPKLVLQVKKTGKSKQAKKRYKLSQAGISLVEDMIDYIRTKDQN